MVVYPRWRGELNIGNGFAAAASGLSPLARGTRQNGLSSLVRLRFIPAGAGSSLRFFVRPGLVPVYPRWRGELGIARLIRRRPYGLSPLARGTPKQRCNTGENARFIPAGAGNTEVVPFLMTINAVYPRWRGEHLFSQIYGLLLFGLSPLARGTPQPQHYVLCVVRFIPAGAGNTYRGLANSQPGSVYPRWRGEHIQ